MSIFEEYGAFKIIQSFNFALIAVDLGGIIFKGFGKRSMK